MSPYRSDAQRKFFHSEGAKKAGISKATVKEFDSASKGMKLPQKVGEDKRFVDRMKSHARPK